MFVALFTLIDTVVANNIASMVGLFAATITPLVGACVVLYAVYLSYRALYDPQNLVVMESVWFLFNLSVVTFIAFNTPWYLNNLVPVVLGSGDEIAGILLGATSAGGGASLQAMFDTIFSQIADMYNIIDLDLFSPSSWLLGALIFFQIFLVLVGFIPFMAVATAYLLVAKLMVSFLLIIGPMFVMMAFFPSTRSFFQAWTGQCFNYALLSLMYPIAFTTYNIVLNVTIFSGDINFSTVIMTPIIFTCLVLLSVQIPVLCSTLSGGVGISGLVGGLGNFVRGANSTAKSVGSVGKSGYTGGRNAVRYLQNLRKGKIKPG